MPREWFGPPDIPWPDVVTPVHGIHVNTRNYDTNRLKQITRGTNKLLANSPPNGSVYPAGIADRFNAIASTLSANLVNWIDDRWTAVAARAARCGISVANVPKPYVLIESTIWQEPRLNYIWVAGLTDPSANLVRLVIIYPSTDGSIPYVYTLAEWEFVNHILCHTVGCPQNLSQEGHFACETSGQYQAALVRLTDSQLGLMTE